MTRLPATPAPKHRTLRSNNIRFCHPGYSSPVNVLFSLPRVDTAPPEPTTFGVDSRVALLACQIVASNAFEKGFLAEDKSGTRRVEAGPDTILTANDYWFFVENDDQYPVVPSFRDWQFPHDQFPSYWRFPTEPASTTDRCPVSNTSYALTDAHLILKEDREWFLVNGMHVYGLGRYDIDDQANIVNLRSDIHLCLDRRAFSFFPKPDCNGVHEFVPHVLSPGFEDFESLYHNRTVHLARTVCPEYLLARFAWAVIHLVKPFIIAGVDRHVAKFERAKTDSDGKEHKGMPKSNIVLLEGASLKSLYGGGGSRSASPRKRKASSPGDEGRNDDDDDDDDDDDHGSGSVDDSDDDGYTKYLQLALERESPRGRKRMRLSDISFATTTSVPPLCHSPSNSSTGSRDSLCDPGKAVLEMASEGKGTEAHEESENVLRGRDRSFDTQ